VIPIGLFPFPSNSQTSTSNNKVFRPLNANNRQLSNIKTVPQKTGHLGLSLKSKNSKTPFTIFKKSDRNMYTVILQNVVS